MKEGGQEKEMSKTIKTQFLLLWKFSTKSERRENLPNNKIVA